MLQGERERAAQYALGLETDVSGEESLYDLQDQGILPPPLSQRQLEQLQAEQDVAADEVGRACMMACPGIARIGRGLCCQ